MLSSLLGNCGIMYARMEWRTYITGDNLSTTASESCGKGGNGVNMNWHVRGKQTHYEGTSGTSWISKVLTHVAKENFLILTLHPLPWLVIILSG